jgi:transposase
MEGERIERVDNLPLILHWLLKMQVNKIIDAIWQPHGNWQGVSYGQLAVLFLAYILYTHDHRLSYVEDWYTRHLTTLEQVTGWSLRNKEMTDDRLGILVSVLGTDEAQSLRYQQMQGQHLIQAYALPTDVARYDTTTFSVYHTPDEEQDGTLFQHGHSKDRRPDLLQFKQALGTLDPAGIPLLTNTVPGNCADDPLYVPAWREMARTIGHKDFLYVADCKASALETRATIDHEDGNYLVPLQMTGNVPDWLREQVLTPPSPPQPVYLKDVADAKGKPCRIGRGFEVEHQMSYGLADGTQYIWSERWLVLKSRDHARRQREALRSRLIKAVDRLNRMRAKSDETTADFQGRAEQVIGQFGVEGLLTVTANETITQKKRYLRPGRPTADSPYKLIEQRKLQLHVAYNLSAIREAMRLAGWRIYVTNVPAAKMSQEQAVAYYRDQWTAERGYHRFKNGSLPALPIFLRIEAHIRGLMLLLMIALQALTLLEFVARRALAEQEESIAGLVPGNPQIETPRPTGERILAQFDHLHLLIEETETEIVGHLVEPLTPLQRQLLALLNIPESVYDLNFSQAKSTNQHNDRDGTDYGMKKLNLQF